MFFIKYNISHLVALILYPTECRKSTVCRNNLVKFYIMTNNVIGNRIKELRTEMNISQKTLGEKLGYCNQTVSFWESGQREPSLDAVVKLATFFKTSTDYLLGFSNY